MFPLTLFNADGLISKLNQKLYSALFYFAINIEKTKIYIYKDPSFKIANGPSVSIANHLCEQDGMYMMLMMNKLLNKDVQPFSKSSVRYYPFGGLILMASQTLFVKPGISDAYMKSRLAITKKYNKNTLIFIEGARYREHIKVDREKTLSSPHIYKNVMIPKTRGVQIIRDTLQHQTEYYVAIRYENYPGQEGVLFDISNMVKGYHPKAVHMYLHALPGDSNIYDSFKKIDDCLDQPLSKWGEKQELVTDKNDKINFILFTLYGLGCLLMLGFPFFQYYFLTVFVYQYYRAFFELRR